MYNGNPGESILVRVSAGFELTRVRVIGSQLYKFDVELGLRARKVSNECGLTILRNRAIEKMLLPLT